MRVFVFLVSGLLKMDFFNESVCFFCLKPIENGFFHESVSFFRLRPIQNWFFNESVCFLVSGIVEDGPALFFQWESLFFGPRPIENVFEWQCLFFGLRHCGRRCCAIFLNEFLLFLGPELFFNERLCLFGFSTIERRFSMRVFFCRQSELKVDFSMKVFLFFVSGLFKIDFSMRVFVSLASGIVEDGAVHFFTWICKFLKTRIVFLMRVFVFWFQAFPAVGNILVLVVAFSN